MVPFKGIFQCPTAPKGAFLWVKTGQKRLVCKQKKTLLGKNLNFNKKTIEFYVFL